MNRLHVIITVLILAIIALLWRSYSIEYAANNNKIVCDTVQKPNGLNDTIYALQQKQDSLEYALSLAKGECIKSKKPIKEPTIVKYIQVPEIIHDTILINSVEQQGIPIGSLFAYSDKWFYISGALGETNVLIDSIGVYTGQVDVTISKQRCGFLKRRKYVVQLSFENKSISPVKSIVVKH